MFLGYTFSEMLVLTNAFLMAFVAMVIGGVAVFIFDALRDKQADDSQSNISQESKKKTASV